MLPVDVDWYEKSRKISYDLREKVSALCSRIEIDGHILNKYIMEVISVEKGKIIICFLESSPLRNKEINESNWRMKYIHGKIRAINPKILADDKAPFTITLSCAALLDTDLNNNSNVIINNTSLSLYERRIIIVLQDENEKIPGLSLPQYTIQNARQLFKFPPNHPIAPTAYAMADVFPNDYVLVSGFHDYFRKTKHAAFVELCASLGAKEIIINHAEINNQTLDVNGDIKAPLASLGLNINIKQNHETGEKIAFRFSEANKGIKKYDSPWINTEPSWRSMITLRRDNHLAEVGAEFNCVDDMGINAKLASNIKTVGINIGGNFTEMTKIHLSYNVTFW